MAGRATNSKPNGIRVADTVRDLRRGLSVRKLSATLKFEAVDEAAVNAAKAKAAAATSAKEAECKRRGERCRLKEMEEGAALAALRPSRRQGCGGSGGKLDTHSGLPGKDREAGPVLEANSQGNALARLFNSAGS